MAVYTYGINVADIQSRIGFMDINDASSPTNADVNDWIKEFAGEVNTVMAELGEDPATYVAGATPTSKDAAYYTIRGKIARRVAAEVHAANQNGDTDLAVRYTSEFNGWFANFRDRPSMVIGSGHSAKPKSSATSGGVTPPVAFWAKDMKL